MGVIVLEGSKLKELVENNESFAQYAEETFRALDKDNSGRLSPQELRPAVATIGIALGLSSQGSSPQADFIYNQIEENQEAQPRAKCLLHALGNVTVEQGMPPASHPLVRKNIVEPSLKKVFIKFNRAITQVEFVELFRKLVLEVALQLKTTPVTVAHSDKAYDGSTISQFLTKKYSLEKTLDTTWKSLPKDQHGALPREYLRVGLDIIAPAAGLPPFGAVEKMDRVVSEIFKMVEADEDRVLNQKEFNKLMLEILGSIILQLQGNPISVSSNAVVTDNPADTGFLPS
eukprot:Gb_01411 [translate_table: standard]